MTRRSILEQEFYERLIEQGVDEESADIIVAENLADINDWGTK